MTNSAPNHLLWFALGALSAFASIPIAVIAKIYWNMYTFRKRFK